MKYGFLLTLAMFFISSTTRPANLLLNLNIVKDFPLTYQNLIDYLNYSEDKINNQIDPEALPENLPELKKDLYAIISGEKNPEYGSLELILQFNLSIESTSFKGTVVENDLNSILIELMIAEEMALLSPKESSRASTCTTSHSSGSPMSLASSRRRSSATETSMSDGETTVQDASSRDASPQELDSSTKFIYTDTDLAALWSALR